MTDDNKRPQVTPEDLEAINSNPPGVTPQMTSALLTAINDQAEDELRTDKAKRDDAKAFVQDTFIPKSELIADRNGRRWVNATVSFDEATRITNAIEVLLPSEIKVAFFTEKDAIRSMNRKKDSIVLRIDAAVFAATCIAADINCLALACTAPEFQRRAGHAGRVPEPKTTHTNDASDRNTGPHSQAVDRPHHFTFTASTTTAFFGVRVLVARRPTQVSRRLPSASLTQGQRALRPLDALNRLPNFVDSLLMIGRDFRPLGALKPPLDNLARGPANLR